MVFDDICFYCGDSEILDNDQTQQLKQDFGIVRPICGECYKTRPVKTRNAKQTKKKK